MSPRLVRSATDLETAVKDFRENYQMFVSKHRQYHDLLNEDGFNIVFDTTDNGSVLNPTAEAFGDRIRTALQMIENRRSFNECKWTTRLGSFAKAIFPVANFSLNLAGSIGDVRPHLLLLTVRRHVFPH